MATNEVFLDTAYAIALSVDGDAFHERAVEWAKVLDDQQAKLITTRAVLLEIGNALSRLRYRAAAVQLLEALEEDAQVECVDVTVELYRQALALFGSRSDKQWGMIDCVSFVVMTQRGLTDALTADEHFQQAGFHALLRE